MPDLGGFGDRATRERCALCVMLRRVFPGCRLARDPVGLVVDVNPTAARQLIIWFDRRRQMWRGKVRGELE